MPLPHSLADSATRRNIKQQLADSVTPQEAQAYANGLNRMPIHKIIQHAQYLDNIILPQVEKKHGIESDNFRQFKGIFDALIWSLHIQSLFDRYQYQLSNERLQMEFYKKKCIWYEQELMRYTTRENLLMEESFMDLKDVMIQAGVKGLKYNYAAARVASPDEVHHTGEYAVSPASAQIETPNDDVIM